MRTVQSSLLMATIGRYLTDRTTLEHLWAWRGCHERTIGIDMVTADDMTSNDGCALRLDRQECIDRPSYTNDLSACVSRLNDAPMPSIRKLSIFSEVHLWA